MRKISENIFWCGCIDWDRRMFDSLIPLPDGTSYNAYFVAGSEKNALIDTVDSDHIEKLEKYLSSVEKIDYIISNHSEQDHSGAIPFVLNKYKEAKLICTPKAKNILSEHLLFDQSRLLCVNDGENISLGNKTLEFIQTPWTNWPETMVTYLCEDKVLFSCDLFGSHLATTDIFADDQMRVYEAAKRYYAEIMMPFRNHISKYLEKLSLYQINMIAPSHGPIYPNPDFIMNAYKDWVLGNPKNMVTIFYISMHGSTKMMVDYLIDELMKRNISVQRFDLAYSDIGKIAISLVDAGTIILGTPTVIGGAHPHIVSATYLANILNPKAKFVSIIGSLGWGGRVVEQLSKLVPNLKAEFIEPIICKGIPKENDLKLLEKMAETICEKHKTFVTI